jgi:hypothetical protein
MGFDFRPMKIRYGPNHYQPEHTAYPLTGRWLRCAGCSHLFIEPRQLNNLREVDGILLGDCPICHTTNNLEAIRLPEQ